MITRNKLKIFKKYSGDIDGWARFGNKSELELMSDDDWKLIDELLQSLESVKKGLVSKYFKSQILNRLEEACDSKETRYELKSMIGEY